eukprot:jgi/Psemu1/62646/estExt_Genemark1.C_60048
MVKKETKRDQERQQETDLIAKLKRPAGREEEENRREAREPQEREAKHVGGIVDEEQSILEKLMQRITDKEQSISEKSMQRSIHKAGGTSSGGLGGAKTDRKERSGTKGQATRSKKSVRRMRVKKGPKGRLAEKQSQEECAEERSKIERTEPAEVRRNNRRKIDVTEEISTVAGTFVGETIGVKG